VFSEPATVIVDRFPNRHTAFGMGPHRCVGSNFARAEAVIMLEEVLARMPDYRLQRSGLGKYGTIGSINGYVKMPADFTPGPRIETRSARLAELRAVMKAREQSKCLAAETRGRHDADRRLADSALRFEEMDQAAREQLLGMIINDDGAIRPRTADDPVSNHVAAGAQRVEQLGQGRLVQGHRGVLLREPG
jgi:hypothetical protein